MYKTCGFRIFVMTIGMYLQNAVCLFVYKYVIFCAYEHVYKINVSHILLYIFDVCSIVSLSNFYSKKTTEIYHQRWQNIVVLYGLWHSY